MQVQAMVENVIKATMTMIRTIHITKKKSMTVLATITTRGTGGIFLSFSCACFNLRDGVFQQATRFQQIDCI